MGFSMRILLTIDHITKARHHLPLYAVLHKGIVQSCYLSVGVFLPSTSMLVNKKNQTWHLIRS